MITISYRGLTPKGNGKIRSIGSLVPRVARVSLRKNFYQTRRAIVSYAPTPSDEANAISRGVYNSGIVGDSGGGRFLKSGGQRSVQAALMEERPSIGVLGTLTFLKWGNTAVINAKIGFSWITSKGQIRQSSTSQQLWGNLIQAWEGMSVGSARVVSRGPYPLRPTNTMFVPYMDKTLPAYNMVRRGYNSTRGAYQSAVRSDIKAAVRKVGLR